MALYDLGTGGRFYDGGDERTVGGYTGGSFSGGTPVAVAPDPFQSGLNSLYQKYYQRDANDQELQAHRGNPGGLTAIESMLKGSLPTATPAASGGPDARSRFSGIYNQYSLDPNNPGYGLGNIDYFLTRLGQTNPNDVDYWAGGGSHPKGRLEQEIRKALYGEVGDLIDTGGGAVPPPSGPSSRGVFDDPATAQWLDLLNKRVDALNTPYQNPQLGQLNSYLQKYFESLQGPAYTPQQMDLMQTQTLDPLTRERDAARQRVLERASGRGLTPQSGIVEKQLSDLDRSFEQIRTQTQANFANKAIDLDRINHQQAAGVAQALANIEQTAFNQNEQRANQALDISRQVPDLARQRLLDANSILAPTQLNPTSLLSLQAQQEQQDAARNQQLWLTLASLVPGILSLFRKNNG